MSIFHNELMMLFLELNLQIYKCFFPYIYSIATLCLERNCALNVIKQNDDKCLHYRKRKYQTRRICNTIEQKDAHEEQQA